MTPPPKPQETELKLVIPTRNDATKVIRKLVEMGYTVERPDNIRIDDLYLDSYDWLLNKNKLSLRYRVENEIPMYTLKSIADFNKGIAQRRETEIVLDSALKAPQEIPVQPIRDQVVPLIGLRKLMELVTTHTLRREYSVTTPQGAKISLAFDSSGFSRERRPAVHLRRRVFEMEAELKGGSPAALAALQKLLAETFNYPPSTQSKLQHAIELLNLAPLTRKPNKELAVKLDDSVQLALHKIIDSEFRWFQQQLPGVLDDVDPEFVHQARVTTRRMRSAVKAFCQVDTESGSAMLAKELKWIAALFGAVRDIDVFIINLDDFEQKIDYFPAKTKHALKDGIEKQRRGPLEKLIAALASPRYKRLDRRIKLFIRNQLIPPNPISGMKTVRQFAPELITGDFQDVMKGGQEVLANPEIKQFHLLRIEMKRLRYATEFVAPAYAGALSGFIQRTVEIQDCLGELQDTVFTRDFSRRLSKKLEDKSEGSNIALVLGEIYQFQAEIAKEHREKFAGIWARFASSETSDLLAKVFQDNQRSL
jgi:inorganic triphosphatase YgiF